ncbi:hypothetical protein CLF_103092, partial [Clonorchis sinensis]
MASEVVSDMFVEKLGDVRFSSFTTFEKPSKEYTTNNYLPLTAFDGLRKQLSRVVDQRQKLRPIRTTAVIRKLIVQRQIFLDQGSTSAPDDLLSMVEYIVLQPCWRSRDADLGFCVFVTSQLVPVTASVRGMAYHITSMSNVSIRNHRPEHTLTIFYLVFTPEFSGRRQDTVHVVDVHVGKGLAEFIGYKLSYFTRRRSILHQSLQVAKFPSVGRRLI